MAKLFNHESKLNVFLTVDVEIWPPGWDLDRANFPKYFDTFINGKTAGGQYGLPFQLELLADHRLKAVFFVEPLFAFEFGIEPLKDIVSLIRSFDQEVQLHLHTEWVGKMSHSILPNRSGINLRDFSADEQTYLVSKGMENLRICGVGGLSTFRAGSFGANEATLRALARNNLSIDSSYNRACDLGPFLDAALWQPTLLQGIKEFPVAIYQDALGQQRHAQINSTSSREFVGLLAQARARSWHSFVAFWHSAELLNESRTRHDPVTVSRLVKLSRYLADNRADMETRWFSEMLDEDLPKMESAGPLSSPLLPSLMKYAEQAARKAIFR